MSETDYKNYATTCKGKILIRFVINIGKICLCLPLELVRLPEVGNFGIGKSSLSSLDNYVDRTGIPLKQFFGVCKINIANGCL